MKKITFLIIGLCIFTILTSLIYNQKEILQKEKNAKFSSDKLVSFLIKGESDTEFKEVNDNSWRNEKYFYLGSVCKDSNGEKIEENVISFNSNRTITLKTNKSLYCNLYFEEAVDLVNALQKSPNLETEANVLDRQDVLRRFQGTAEEVNDNYICFGTNDLEECTNNADKYMYRVIGYALADDDTTETKKGQVKLQKKEALEQGYQWADGGNINTQWPNSLVYEAISGKDYLENSTYVPNDWKSKIATHRYFYGDTGIIGGTSAGKNNFLVENGKLSANQAIYCPVDNRDDCTLNSEVYANDFGAYEKPIYYKYIKEPWTNKIELKVSLIGMSDYYLSVRGDINCSSSSGGAACKAGWMHLSNNDSTENSVTHLNPPDAQEYTMIHHGYDPWWNGFSYHTVHEDGIASGWTVDVKRYFSARPVIYINSGLLVLGEGTITNPYRIIN